MYLAPRRCHSDNSSSNQRLQPSNTRLCFCSSFSKAYPSPFQHSEHLGVSYHEINSILSSECVCMRGVRVCPCVCICVHMCAHAYSAHEVKLRCLAQLFSVTLLWDRISVFFTFPHCCHKIPCQSNLREKGLILTHSLRVQFTMARKTVSQELKAAGNIASPSRDWQVAELSSLSPFSTVQGAHP